MHGDPGPACSSARSGGHSSRPHGRDGPAAEQHGYGVVLAGAGLSARRESIALGRAPVLAAMVDRRAIGGMGVTTLVPPATMMRAPWWRSAHATLASVGMPKKPDRLTTRSGDLTVAARTKKAVGPESTGPSDSQSSLDKLKRDLFGRIRPRFRAAMIAFSRRTGSRRKMPRSR